MFYFTTIIEAVGRTPLVKLNRITAGLPATIAIKASSRTRSAASKTASAAP